MLLVILPGRPVDPWRQEKQRHVRHARPPGSPRCRLCCHRVGLASKPNPASINVAAEVNLPEAYTNSIRRSSLPGSSPISRTSWFSAHQPSRPPSRASSGSVQGPWTTAEMALICAMYLARKSTGNSHRGRAEIENGSRAEVARRLFGRGEDRMNDAPLIRMCGMYENVSKDGSTYYAGYLGGVKLLLLKNKKTGEGVRHPGPCCGDRSPREGRQCRC